MEYSLLTVLFLIATLVLLAQGAVDDSAKISIGIIADSSTPLAARENDVNVTCNVSVYWRYVDFNEAFRVFGAVRQFDMNPQIDFILLADYSPLLWIPAKLLETNNKALIKLHKDSTEYTQNLLFNISREYTNDSVAPADSSSSEPHCKESRNTSNITSSSTTMGDTITTVPLQIIAHLIRQQKWTTIHVFYDTITERETTLLLDLVSTYGVAFTLFNVDDINNLHDVLLQMYAAALDSKPQIVVLCRFECLFKVFHAANKFDVLNKDNPTLMTLFSRWLAIFYNYNTFAAALLESIASELSNVAILVVPELNSIPTHKITSHIQYIVEDEGVHLPENVNTKKDMMENIKKGLIAWSPVSSCNAYIIKTLLWTKSGRDFSDVGHAYLNSSIKMTSDLFPNIKYGYSHRLFTITTIAYPPFVIDASTNGTRKFNGVCMDLLHELARVLNFTYRLVDPPDNKWGTVDSVENDTFIFNGMVGQLQRHEVDIAAAPLAIIPVRQHEVDFSYPVYHEYTTVVLKKPDQNIYKWRTLIDPFKINVLLFIGVSLLVVTVLVFLIEKYGAYYALPEHAATRRDIGGLHTLHNSFWYIYGALLCQGGVHLPDSFAGRTLVSGWWIFCIVIVGTYCGNLIAFLTVSKDVTPFNTLDEMASMKGELKWGTLGGSNWEFVFKTSNLPDFRKIGDAMMEFNKSDPGIFHLSTDYHIARVKQGGYAWIGDKTTIELAMSKECDLINIKEEFLPMKYGFAFQQKSPHTAIFSDQVMKSQEAGLFEIWRRKWWPTQNFCFSDAVATATPITLRDVQSAHYVCVIGFAVGFIAFLTEVLVFRFRKNADGGKTDANTPEVSLSQVRDVTAQSDSDKL